ncbi:hypothetical protein GmHk_02G004035 [Glycine max]|nr:hypothetical protein GmHk_02G004035 [Glycine max]
MLILPWCSVFYHVPNTKVKELMDGYNIFGFSKMVEEREKDSVVLHFQRSTCGVIGKEFTSNYTREILEALKLRTKGVQSEEVKHITRRSEATNDIYAYGSA